MAATRSTEASETWEALLVSFTGIYHELALELDEQHGVSMERYEVLLMLFVADKPGLRHSDLASRLRLSRSGATRLVDRLVKDGLVERNENEGDRRASMVSLTPNGVKSFQRLGRAHLAGIEKHLGTRLTLDECLELRRLLGKIKVGGESESFRDPLRRVKLRGESP